MARLTNESDQAAIVFEVYGRPGIAPEWIGARLAMQHYAESVNAFHTFAEGRLKIQEPDLRRLARLLRGLVEVEDESRNFCYEPEAEASFGLACARLAPAHPFYFLVEAALDLKAVLPGSSSARYRENRLTLRLQTTEARMERFLAELLKEIDSALM